MADELKEEEIVEEETVEEEVEDRGDEITDPEDEAAEEIDVPEEDEEEPAEDEEEESESPMIPKSRFDQKNTEAKDLRDENAWLREQLEKVVGKEPEAKEEEISEGPSPEEIASELSEKRREMMSAIADGDIDYALEVEDEINEIRERETEQRAQRYAQKTLEEQNRVQQQQDADALSEQILADHPELLEDEALLQEFRDYQEFRAYKGDALVDSLRAAEAKVFGTSEAKEDPPPRTTSRGRKKESVARNIKAQEQQPPVSRKGVGQRASANRRVEDMTEAEFDKLSDAEKKKMRGD